MWRYVVFLRLLILANILVFANSCASPASSLMENKRSQDTHQPLVQANATAMSQKVLIAYRIDNSELTLHEPVVVRFSVQNNLAVPIQLDLGRDRKGSFLFTIVKPEGKTLELSQPTREGISLLGKLSVKPGEVYEQDLLVNEWSDFPTPGTYVVKVKLSTPILTDDGTSVPANNRGEIKLNIAPRNPERLKAVSSSLLEHIVKASSYEEAAAAALELSYVDDPIAVPSLEKALSSGRMVEPIVISGLERLGNDEAVEVLISTLKNQNNETSELARSALANIAQKTSDMVLKEKIRRAI